jgi:hypothetical protein
MSTVSSQQKVLHFGQAFRAYCGCVSSVERAQTDNVVSVPNSQAVNAHGGQRGIIFLGEMSLHLCFHSEAPSAYVAAKRTLVFQCVY